jgi:murein DD-endopeptidase MepM/ murein hydrolase activator NlpD
MLKQFSKQAQASFLFSGLVSLLFGTVIASEASANPKMPFTGSASVTQSAHSDGYGLRAIDLGLRAGSAVIAPNDSVVVATCNAGNNHRAIKLRSGSTFYSLIHVTTSNIAVGKTYRQGELIGTVAADRPNNACARSTGVHLHFGVSSNNPIVDGINLLNVRYGTTIRSSNVRR